MLISFLVKINAFIQYWRLFFLVRASGLFDKTWYLAKNPDVVQAKADPLFHYLRRGGFEGRDPGPNFSSNWYLHTYDDVKGTRLNPLVHYLKYGEQQGRKPKPDPIVVHQMGKVGSKTVRLSLLKAYESLGIDIRVYHTHALNNFDVMRKAALLNKEERSPVGTLTALKYGEIVRKQIDESPAQHWNVITLVRDPVARNIATFFNNLTEFIPDWRERYADGKLNAGEIHQLFFSKNSMFAALDNWFDPQIKSIPAIGIDVYEIPFPHEIGYKIYPCVSQASLLLIRQESLNECAGRAMDAFLGLKDFVLHNTNVADEKDYADLYRAFKEIPLPVGYIENIYKTQYARHFYSEQELEQFAQRWTKSAKTENRILSHDKRVTDKEQTALGVGKDKTSFQQQAQAAKKHEPTNIRINKTSTIASAFHRTRSFIFRSNRASPHQKNKQQTDLELLRSSSLFDEGWYVANYPDVARAKIDPALHYLRNGGFEGRDPGPNFSSNWYMDTYEDVRKARLNPLIHYLRYGQEHGRILQSELDLE